MVSASCKTFFFLPGFTGAHNLLVGGGIAASRLPDFEHLSEVLHVGKVRAERTRVAQRSLGSVSKERLQIVQRDATQKVSRYFRTFVQFLLLIIIV